MQLYYMKRDGIPLPEGTAVLMAVATAYKFVLAVVGMMILLFWQKLLKEHLGGYFFWYIAVPDSPNPRYTRKVSRKALLL